MMENTINSKLPAKSICQAIMLLMFLSACVGVLTNNPLTKDEREFDSRLLGNWLSEYEEVFYVEGDSDAFEITAILNKQEFAVTAYSGRIDGIQLISVDLNNLRKVVGESRESHTVIPENGGFLLFLYRFVSENEIALTPLDDDFFMDRVESGAIKGEIDDSCEVTETLTENLDSEISGKLPNIKRSLFCPILNISPKAIKSEIFNSKLKLFDRENTLRLRRIG